MKRDSRARSVVASGREAGAIRADCEKYYVFPKRAAFAVSARRIHSVPRERWGEYYRTFIEHEGPIQEGALGESEEGLERVWSLLFGCSWAMSPRELSRAAASTLNHFALSKPVRTASLRPQTEPLSATARLSAVVPCARARGRGRGCFLGNFECYDEPGATPGFHIRAGDHDHMRESHDNGSALPTPGHKSSTPSRNRGAKLVVTSSPLAHKLTTLDDGGTGKALDAIPAPPRRWDVCVVGAGLSGAVIAERFASTLGKSVLVVEKRRHIAGNCYDYLDRDTGLRLNLYGPHNFHTKLDHVWRYMKRYGNWTHYYHKKLAWTGGRFVPMPVNSETLCVRRSLDPGNPVVCPSPVPPQPLTTPPEVPESRPVRAATRCTTRTSWARTRRLSSSRR